MKLHMRRGPKTTKFFSLFKYSLPIVIFYVDSIDSHQCQHTRPRTVWLESWVQWRLQWVLRCVVPIKNSASNHRELGGEHNCAFVKIVLWGMHWTKRNKQNRYVILLVCIGPNETNTIAKWKISTHITMMDSGVYAKFPWVFRKVRVRIPRPSH